MRERERERERERRLAIFSPNTVNVCKARRPGSFNPSSLPQVASWQPVYELPIPFPSEVVPKVKDEGSFALSPLQELAAYERRGESTILRRCRC